MTDQNLSTIPDEIQERWLPIPGFPGYDVSDQGRVRSYWRVGANKSQMSVIPQRTLRPGINWGYPFVILCKNKKHYNSKIHHLVLITFVGPCPPGMETCHNDGIRHHCTLDNLRWDTRSHNHLDKHKHGTSHAGEQHPHVKLTESKVIQIRELYAQGFYSMEAIGKMFNVRHSTVGKIVHRQRWKHI